VLVSDFGYVFVLTIAGCFSSDANEDCNIYEFEYRLTTPGQCMGMRKVILDAYQHHPGFKIDEEKTRCSVSAHEIETFEDETTAVAAGQARLRSYTEGIAFSEALQNSVDKLIDERSEQEQGKQKSKQ